MKIKNLITILAVAGAISVSSLTANAAENIGFDPVYYAAEYPDVYAAFGNDTNLLYQHYILFGIKEGRYQIYSSGTSLLYIQDEVTTI